MNIQQRKALEKIVNITIDKKSSGLYNKKYEERNQKENEIEKSKKKEALILYKKILDFKEKAEKVEEEMKELGFKIEYGERDITVSLPNKIDEAIDDKYKKKEDDLDNLKIKLGARVWGVEGDFNTLLLEIENELKAI